ncbi:MAG: acyl-CoA dehydrogenase family protein [Hyphomicrobiales bacterium]|nr:acyl-CoA dehydrogenase family protein [Hyphomicrobiales bacterium]
MKQTPTLTYRNIPDSYGTNAYLADPDFARLLRIYMDEDTIKLVEPRFVELGALVRGEMEDLALAADRNPPVLRLRARNSSDLQALEKHPSYIALERYAFSEYGLAALSHRGGVFGRKEKLHPAVKYGLTMLFVQAEFGLCCPLSMTDSLTRTLCKFGSKELIDRYFSALTTQTFEDLYQGAMFITEQDAGSDVGAVTTQARFEDGEWRLYGDKWFCSNVDADLAMVLARPAGGQPGTKGLSLFLLPRRRQDGTLNAYRILRLKPKLGTRSMASGEIVMEGAVAYLVGEPASGFKQMTDMINMSRLSNGVRSAGLMLRAVGEALYIAKNRTAFGKPLIELPLMRRQLVKMMVTAEQGRSFCLHMTEVLRRADAGDPLYAKLMRIMTPLIKFRTCRDARKVAGDGMEARGGSGYIEEWSDARVLRDAHLGSIWEGTSNVVALDVKRAIRREGSLEALRTYATQLLGNSGIPARSRDRLASAFARAADLADIVAAAPEREEDVRRMASALYNAVSAIIMAWEAGQSRNARRLALAHFVVRHKLDTQDPLAASIDDRELVDRLIAGHDVSDELAMSNLA